jgi:hypothetical protein
LSGSLSALFGQWHSIEPEIVKTVLLADYLLENGVSRAMLKVDVEGTGAQVWSGLAECFSRISYLVIEILTPEIKDELPERIIRETGWHADHIRDFELIAAKDGQFTYREPFWNWLFCGLDSSALTRRLSGTKLRVISAAWV